MSWTIWGTSRRFGTGRWTIGVVWDGLGTLEEVRDGSGDSMGGL